MFDALQDVAAGRLQRNVARTLDVGQAFEHEAESDFCFEPGQGSAEAEVDAVTEGKVPVGRAVNVEAVRVGELLLVAVGLSQSRPR